MNTMQHASVASESVAISAPAQAAILAVLRDPAAPEDRRRQAVLEAEVLDLAPEQIAELQPLLSQFVLANRMAEDEETLIAVCSAIRQVAYNQAPTDLERLADLLDTSIEEPLSVTVEQEIAKVTVRKLTTAPLASDDPAPRLGTHLYEMFTAYLHPRLVGRRMFGAATLNAALSLILLRTAHRDRIIRLLLDTKASWITEMVASRMSRHLQDLEARGEAFQPTVSAIRSFLQSLKSA
jgi:hypothetical protein